MAKRFNLAEWVFSLERFLLQHRGTAACREVRKLTWKLRASSMHTTELELNAGGGRGGENCWKCLKQ